MISPEQERQLAHGDQRVVCALNDENAYWKSPAARIDHIAYRCWQAHEYGSRDEMVEPVTSPGVELMRAGMEEMQARIDANLPLQRPRP